MGDVSIVKRSKIQENGPPPTTSTMESLPREIMRDILSRLPITSLIHVKLVCRYLHNIMQDSVLANLHFTRTAKNNPYLILHCDFPIQSHLYSVNFSASKENTETLKRIRVPMMSEFDMVGSCNGLLCLCDALFQRAMYLCNPFTKDYLNLPEPEQYLKQQDVAIGFGFLPTTKEYKVVRIVYYRESYQDNLQQLGYSLPQSEIQILIIGSSSWRNLGQASYQLERRASHVLVNRRLHWVTCRHRFDHLRKLISFDLEDEQFRMVPEPNCNNFGRRHSHLVMLGGCLGCVVYNGCVSFDIWIMKKYDVKESWTRELSIAKYSPRGLQRGMDPFFKFSKFYRNRSSARVICLLENGEILLQYGYRALVSYNPEFGTFKELTFQGMPKWFETAVHAGSLNWIDTLIDL